MYYYFYDTILGLMKIVEEDHHIIEISFSTDINRIEKENMIKKETTLLKEANKQLKAYLNGELTTFSLPMSPKGTLFMKSVWKQLQQIPYAQTATYKEIAINLNNPNAARAVGLANHRNPIPIIIPCHRVIGTNGKLVGYAGGIERKSQLLAIEKMYCRYNKNSITR